MLSASGDKTGLADGLAISDCIARNGRVELGDGQFYVNQPFLHVTELRGTGRTVVKYVGQQTTEYLFRVDTPSDYTPRTIVSGVELDCGWMCRGMACLGQWYHKRVKDTRVDRACEIGVDVVDCYGSVFDNLEVSRTRGLALRINTCSGSRFSNIRISGTVAGRVEGGTVQEWAIYEIKHGRRAAMQHFGDRFQEWWPSESDTSVVGHPDGTPVQLQKHERAAVFVNAHSLTLDNVIFEGNYGGEKPLIYLREPCYLFSVNQMYCEANYNGIAKVLMQPRNDRFSIMHTLMFRDVCCTDVMDKSLKCQSFIKSTGWTSNIEVSNARLEGIRKCVLLVDGGRHFGNQIIGIRSESNRIDPMNFIVTENGGVHDMRTPYSLDHDAIVE